MSAIHAAFADAPRESQQVFRALMNAMARPGLIIDVDAGFAPPAPLNMAAAAVLLTLADFETAVWADTGSADAAQFLRFHTGARLIDERGLSDFALVTDALNAPSLDSFPQGTPDYPDRSATLIVQVEAFGQDWRLSGSGIDGQTRFSAAPLPAGFLAQWRDNHARFPRGVDILFADGGQIAALPRSTQIVETG